MLKNTKWKDKLLHIKLPHTYVLLTMILLAVVAMAYVIPPVSMTAYLMKPPSEPLFCRTASIMWRENSPGSSIFSFRCIEGT